MRTIKLNDILALDYDYIIIDFLGISAINNAFLWGMKNNECVCKTATYPTNEVVLFLKENKLEYETTGSCDQITAFWCKYENLEPKVLEIKRR